MCVLQLVCNYCGNLTFPNKSNFKPNKESGLWCHKGSNTWNGVFCSSCAAALKPLQCFFHFFLSCKLERLLCSMCVKAELLKTQIILEFSNMCFFVMTLDLTWITPLKNKNPPNIDGVQWFSDSTTSKVVPVLILNKYLFSLISRFKKNLSQFGTKSEDIWRKSLTKNGLCTFVILQLCAKVTVTVT